MKILNNIKKYINLFILYKINKDLIFIKNVSVLNQLIFFYYIIFVFILFYLNLVTYEKFLSFLFLWVILLGYKIIIDVIIFYTTNNYDLKLYIELNDNKFEKIIKMLLFIQKWKNPLLILLLLLDKIFYKILRILIYKLKNNKVFSYKKNALKNIFYFQYFLFNILYGPLKLMFGFYYNMLFNLVEMPFSLFLLIRSFSFVLNILIISHIYKYIYIIFGIKIYIFIYIILIIVIMIVKIIDKDFKYVKIRHINLFQSIDYINFLRNSGTICGVIILNINLYRKNKLTIKYIDIISSLFKKDLEECFNKYWEDYKRNVLLQTINVWKEIKNRPSWFIYQNLVAWTSASSAIELNGPTYITNLLYIKYKVNKLNLKLPVDIEKDLDYLYNIDKLRLKLLIFMLWDIDFYVGNREINYLTYIINIDLFNIGCDYTIFNYYNIDNFKVEENIKDLPFYDPENNMEFFNQLYLIIGMPVCMEHPLTKIFSVHLNNYINLKKGLEKRLIGFYVDDPLNNTWVRIEEEPAVEDPINDEDNVSLIEYKIRDWIAAFLEEAREEWLILSEKESIEYRNWRLLDEIKFLLRKKDK